MSLPLIYNIPVADGFKKLGIDTNTMYYSL
jgi:hypothetical protein